MEQFKQIIDENLDFKSEVKNLNEKLKTLQLELINKEISVVLIVDGFSVSGKGNMIAKIVKPFDPRFLKVVTINKENEKNKMKPYLHTFAINEPSKSHMTIFDRSWHRRALSGYEKAFEKDGRSDKKKLKKFFELSNSYEKQLIDNGTVVAKIFIDISKKEQGKRLVKLSDDKLESFRVSKEDFSQNLHYNKYKKAFTNVLELTSDYSRWCVVNGDDKDRAEYEAYLFLIDKLTEALVSKENTIQEKYLCDEESKIDVSMLYEHSYEEKPDYKEKLNDLQKRMRKVQYTLYHRREALVIAYEGQDAAGKGGNIKRLTEKLDPRGYDVFSIASPTKQELSHYHMWRFWKKFPKDGHIAIFDRSWYGRVLVERLEGFCSEDDWKRAYKEMNDVEEHLTQHGVHVYKFFLNVDKDEQLRRFKAREEDPLKKHKITDEDWRNREKWDEYMVAYEDMLKYTSTKKAKWYVIDANVKHNARIEVLEILVKDLEEKLEID